MLTNTIELQGGMQAPVEPPAGDTGLTVPEYRLVLNLLRERRNLYFSAWSSAVRSQSLTAATLYRGQLDGCQAAIEKIEAVLRERAPVLTFVRR